MTPFTLLLFNQNICLRSSKSNLSFEYTIKSNKKFKEKGQILQFIILNLPICGIRVRIYFRIIGNIFEILFLKSRIDPHWNGQRQIFLFVIEMYREWKEINCQLYANKVSHNGSFKIMNSNICPFFLSEVRTFCLTMHNNDIAFQLVEFFFFRLTN